MSGTVISNKQLVELVEKHEIEIRPFEPERAQTVHYPIDPETIYVKKATGWTQVHSFRDRKEEFSLAPGQYVIVEIRQHIAPRDGYVGVFVPASNLIEKGLSLTAGKIGFPFGQKNERVRFGIRNNMAEQTLIGPGDLMAYIQFFDLSSSARVRYELSDRDLKIYAKRRARASDDGVFYEDDNGLEAPV